MLTNTKKKGLTALPLSLALALCTNSAAVFAQELEENSTQLLWGDTHLHTNYSFDAYLNQNESVDPDTAYRWAKGLPVLHPYTKARVKINTPLDFLVVSDHAEGLGLLRAIVDEDTQYPETTLWSGLKRWFAIKTVRNALEDGTGTELFLDMLPKGLFKPGSDPVQDEGNTPINTILGDVSAIGQSAWGNIVDSAEKHNEPGKFTAFLGWEWSSIPAGANLHRVVITPNGADKAKQYLPFSAIDSQYPEDLWAWLSKTSEATNSQFIAIPHNSNISKGYMFPAQTLKGETIGKDYARTRMSWEPIVEITQIKGDSEAHPSLSPEDKFADFENFDHYLQTQPEDFAPQKGDFVRNALQRGLEIEKKQGINPYKFGVIGSTDAHTGLSSAEEENFWGKMPYDSIPENKAGGTFTKTKPIDEQTGPKGWDMAAQGLAAVWAKENTRQSIFEAFKRREVYATTGPRIALRFFAGWDFKATDAQASDFASIGYSNGVPMGSDLSQAPNDSSPNLLIRATQDPKADKLERVQVIKGWLEGNTSHEKIYDVALSDQRTPSNLNTQKVPVSTVENGQAVSDIKGDSQFSTFWTDPNFNPAQRAFYYIRVLQVPSLRHSQMDAIALGAENSYAKTIQERAYSSPIWYTP